MITVRATIAFPFKEDTMLLMTLKGIKRMLDKAIPIPSDFIPVTNPADYPHKEISLIVANVENARDMLEELIKECEKAPKKTEIVSEELPPGGAHPSDLSPEAEAAKDEIIGG